MAAPGESERMAAYDIQVELVTRIGVQELAPGTGSLGGKRWHRWNH